MTFYRNILIWLLANDWYFEGLIFSFGWQTQYKFWSWTGVLELLAPEPFSFTVIITGFRSPALRNVKSIDRHTVCWIDKWIEKDWNEREGWERALRESWERAERELKRAERAERELRKSSREQRAERGLKKSCEWEGSHIHSLGGSYILCPPKGEAAVRPELKVERLGKR